MNDNFIVVFKNFNRYEHLNLSIKTVKQFVSEKNIYCFDFYQNEYDDAKYNLIHLAKQNIIAKKSKYVFNKSDKILNMSYDVEKNWLTKKHYERTSTHYEPFDHTFCNLNDLPNSINTLFFSEGYNAVYDHFKDYNGKLLCMNEDQFFTTGKTIQDLKENDFDLAWANWNWPTNLSVNGSILCFNPSKCSSLFPLPEFPVFVDSCYYEFIVARQKRHQLKLYKMKYRNGEDYGNDGIRTNNYHVMLNYIVTNFPQLLTEL